MPGFERTNQTARCLEQGSCSDFVACVVPQIEKHLTK